jgi:hypothetical protein
MSEISRRAGVGQRTPYRVMSGKTISRITERLLLSVEP